MSEVHGGKAAPRGSGMSRTAADLLPKYRGRTSGTLGWTPPPVGLELLQVFYLLRHGERTPVRPRLLTATPPIPEHWNLCHTSHAFDKAVLQFAQHDPEATEPTCAPIRRRVEFAGLDQAPAPGAPGDCSLGELTDIGRASMLCIGQAMRRVYVDKLHFFPTELRSCDAPLVYFRSTNVGRTLQSMDQVITGLLGPFLHTPGTLVPQVFVRNPVQEDMVPNGRPCQRLAQLMRRFAQEAAALYNPRLAELDAYIAPHIGEKARVDGPPRLSGLIDTARAARAHAIPTPSLFTDQAIGGLMEEAVVHEWFAGYEAPDAAERLQYRRLAMGELLASFYERFAHRVAHPDDPLRLGVLLGHDATLIGFLHVLDCFNGLWPDFAAAIGCELFQDTQRDGRAYVRCRYGDETLRIPGCAPEGKHFPGRPELCTLEAFREVVVDRLRHPQNASREEECNSLSPPATN